MNHIGRERRYICFLLHRGCSLFLLAVACLPHYCNIMKVFMDYVPVCGFGMKPVMNGVLFVLGKYLIIWVYARKVGVL